MATETERHRALLAMHDRAYRRVVDILKCAGYSLPHEGQTAYQWAEEEARTGNPKAQFCIAKLTSAGLFAVQDMNLARSWCEESARQEYPPAVAFLAHLVVTERTGHSPDFPKAVELLERAAKLGEVGALHSLATLYLNSRVPHVNREKALSLLRTAAHAGDSIAQVELGLLLVDAEDPALEVEGLRWIRASAEGGIATAHRMLGSYYRVGEHGLPQDVETALAHESAAGKLESEYL